MADADKTVAGHLAGQEPVSGTPHVEFMGVGKSYDGVTQVVRDLDLTVYEGEFLTLLGPSGSGKTTCLMMLAGFEAPSAGASASVGGGWTTCRHGGGTSGWCSRTMPCSRT